VSLDLRPRVVVNLLLLTARRIQFLDGFGGNRMNALSLFTDSVWERQKDENPWIELCFSGYVQSGLQGYHFYAYAPNEPKVTSSPGRFFRVSGSHI
jgi:hypothetical protein